MTGWILVDAPSTRRIGQFNGTFSRARAALFNFTCTKALPDKGVHEVPGFYRRLLNRTTDTRDDHLTPSYFLARSTQFWWKNAVL